MRTKAATKAGSGGGQGMGKPGKGQDGDTWGLDMSPEDGEDGNRRGETWG